MAWAAVVAWALAIFTLSSQPGDPAGGGARLRLSWEKVAHFVEFALLAVGTANALTVSGTRSRRFWWTFVLCALYAVTDELHQVTVPHRNPEVFDVIIDMAGASAGYLAYRWLSVIEIPKGRWAVALASRRRSRRSDRNTSVGGGVG
jgi:VanZ family protein